MALAWMLGTDARVVLDLAAGTGQISRQLDRPGLEVVAVEPERARLDTHVLAAVEERFPGAGVVELPMRAWCWRVDHIGTGPLSTER